MVDIKFEYPKLVAKEQNSKTEMPIREWQGVVTKEGSWGFDKNGFILSPGDWQITKLGTGVYKITHFLGYSNLAINVSLFQSPGSIIIINHNPTDVTIQTSLNGTPTDMPFAFTMSQIISAG